MDGLIPLRSWADWCVYIPGKGSLIEQETGNIVCWMNQLLPSLLSTNYKKTGQALQEMGSSMEKPSISTEHHRSDVTSQYTKNGTPDPTSYSGNDSERDSEGRQGKGGTKKVAELVKAILETAWKDSSPEVQSCLKETLQEQGPDAVSGADWQWQYSAPSNGHSRLSRDLSDPPVAVERIGTSHYAQIGEVFTSEAMLPPGRDERKALLGDYQMMFAGCLIRCGMSDTPERVLSRAIPNFRTHSEKYGLNMLLSKYLLAGSD
jgi:hypothetical protein